MLIDFGFNFFMRYLNFIIFIVIKYCEIIGNINFLELCNLINIRNLK